MDSDHTEWYTRRDHVVRGPFTRAQLSRYILLGRIQDVDELSNNQWDWKPLSAWPDLVPRFLLCTERLDDYERLIEAHLAVDERQSGDRRMGQQGGAVSGHMERRSGQERRILPPGIMLHRYLVTRLWLGENEYVQYRLLRRRFYLGTLITILLGFLAVTVHSADGETGYQGVSPDCENVSVV